MTDDERERLAQEIAAIGMRYVGASKAGAAAAAQIRADGERIKALKAALAGLIGLFDDDPPLPGEDHQDEIDRRLRRAREVLKEPGND